MMSFGEATFDGRVLFFLEIIKCILSCIVVIIKSHVLWFIMCATVQITECGKVFKSI